MRRTDLLKAREIIRLNRTGLSLRDIAKRVPSLDESKSRVAVHII